ncbi:hypothetical protein ACFWVF_25545 [Streptomyces sp. NPDC058659]|uniref:hypothetical protein n=1 Tax=unclassified Streptomyces TaxID=2593676 RepID=UPI0036569BF8
MAGGRRDELAAGEAESVAAWLSDPEADADAVPCGGASLRSLWVRVTTWMDALEPGALRAVAGPSPGRTGSGPAVAHALGAPGAAFWRLDVRPLPSVELTGRGGRWNVGTGSVLS